MRKVTVFCAWQSDTPQRFNRYLIRMALEMTARRLNADQALDVELIIDSDTQGGVDSSTDNADFSLPTAPLFARQPKSRKADKPSI
jgi:hypothetical protein